MVPYSNIGNKYQLPKFTDRLKSKDILIELVIDSKNNFINPINKIINPELKSTKLKKENYNKSLLRFNTRNPS